MLVPVEKTWDPPRYTFGDITQEHFLGKHPEILTVEVG